MDSDPSGKLEAQVAELTSRVWLLEQAMRKHGIALEQESARKPDPVIVQRVQLAQPAQASPPLAAPPVPPPPVVAAASRPPDPAPFSRTAAPPSFRSLEDNRLGAAGSHDPQSLESRIASQWFNRIGILAVLIAMAWFLKFAIDNHWIGPLGRVLIGLVAGAGLVLWSERFRSKGYAGFSYSLKALGSGILYLSLWAAFSYFHLIPAPAAFFAMVLVTAFNGYMAWVQDAELLALYAIAGGLTTPLLVSTGENHEIALFGYLLVLDLAVLVLVALRPWSRLLFAAYAGTVVFVIGWWAEFFSQAQALRTAAFIASFFLLFAFAPRLVRLDLDESSHVSGWDTLALVLLPVANAALGFIAFYGLMTTKQAEWGAPWLAVGMAGFYLLLMRLAEKGILHSAPGVLTHLHLTVAVVFLTIAIPLKTHGRWLTIGWLAEGAALMWLARKVRSALLLVLAVLCLILGLGALLIVNVDAEPARPIFNARFGCYLAAIAVFALVGWLARQASRDGDQSQHIWMAIAPAAGIAANVLALIGGCLEINSYWTLQHGNGNWRMLAQHRMYAQFSYSAFLMLYGAALLTAGFWRRSAFLRWQALVLIAASIGKVFLADMSELSQGYRILSFLGLGALLLAVSFVYQRDWLNLRKHSG